MTSRLSGTAASRRFSFRQARIDEITIADRVPIARKVLGLPISPHIEMPFIPEGGLTSSEAWTWLHADPEHAEAARAELAEKARYALASAVLDRSAAISGLVPRQPKAGADD